MSNFSLIAIICALVAGVIGVQTLRLANAKHDLTAARAQVAAYKGAVAASEANRATEHQNDTNAASAAEKACSDRVAQALKTGGKIRTIVQKVRNAPVDPQTHCPGRSVIPASELRDLFQGP